MDRSIKGSITDPKPPSPKAPSAASAIAAVDAAAEAEPSLSASASSSAASIAAGDSPDSGSCHAQRTPVHTLHTPVHTLRLKKSGLLTLASPSVHKVSFWHLTQLANTQTSSRSPTSSRSEVSPICSRFCRRFTAVMAVWYSSTPLRHACASRSGVVAAHACEIRPPVQGAMQQLLSMRRRHSHKTA